MRVTDKEKGDAFLAELTELTRKHGIKIEACGCCGSPWLEYTDDLTGSYQEDPTPPYTDIEYGHH